MVFGHPIVRAVATAYVFVVGDMWLTLCTAFPNPLVQKYGFAWAAAPKLRNMSWIPHADVWKNVWRKRMLPGAGASSARGLPGDFDAMVGISAVGLLDGSQGFIKTDPANQSICYLKIWILWKKHVGFLLHQVRLDFLHFANPPKNEEWTRRYRDRLEKASRRVVPMCLVPALTLVTQQEEEDK